MAYPTDDELEAMAVRLECDHWFDAAAMLRACKGGAGVEALKKWLAHEENLCRASGDRAGTIAYSRVWAKLSALEPASDHDTWNAALEEAAKEIDCGCDGACMWPHACPKEDIEAIRQLKKGPDHE